MMPLIMSDVGDQKIILKITGKDEVRQHLSDLGFVVGETVTVVSKIGGSMIVAIKDSRIALDKNLTSRIMI